MPPNVVVSDIRHIIESIQNICFAHTKRKEVNNTKSKHRLQTRSEKAIVGTGIFFLCLNIILVITLLATASVLIPIKERLLVDDFSAVERELKDQSWFSEENDIRNIRTDLFYSEKGNLDKPAIHLQRAQHIDTDEAMTTLHWEEDGGTSSTSVTFTGEGLVYSDGEVTVTDAGYYFIYTTVTYRGNDSRQLDYGRIIHKVLMQKEYEENESPLTLMQTLQSTSTIRRGRLAFTSSSLGGTFHLPKRANVKVISSNPANIDTSPLASNFGIFLV